MLWKTHWQCCFKLYMIEYNPFPHPEKQTKLKNKIFLAKWQAFSLKWNQEKHIVIDRPLIGNSNFVFIIQRYIMNFWHFIILKIRYLLQFVFKAKFVPTNVRVGTTLYYNFVFCSKLIYISELWQQQKNINHYRVIVYLFGKVENYFNTTCLTLSRQITTT